LDSLFLSLIIPAYNEETRLPDTLEQALGFLGRQDFTYEVIVVENGSHDRTLQIAQEIAAAHPQLRVIHEDGRGKGLAIRSGMLQARGEYRFMADADLSMPIGELLRFLPPQLADFDVAIGSRESPGARRYDEPLHRHLGGRLVNLAIRLLALPGLQDTQCGFKCFHAPAAQALFSRMRQTGWSFDVEILYIANLLGYRVVEIPIPWFYRPSSKVNPVRDALWIIRDILRIRGNARRGLYRSS
jgi:dolichyl-phosphate beta-glucosyltransferase